MRTSETQTLETGRVKSTSSQEDFLANHFQTPGKEEEIMTTVISGRRCYDQYGKYSPLGSLVKMLTGSPIWWNPLKKLKWDAQTISSMRVSYIERKRNSPSGEYVKTLNKLDIGSSLLLFRLVPSELRTDETGYGLLPTVQTQGIKTCNSGKTEFMNPDLLPTPTASEAIGKAQIVTGKTITRKSGIYTARLMDLGMNGLLPTPTAIDGGSGRMNKSLSKGAKERPTIALMARLSSKQTGTTSKLNPRYVAEMMGFPTDWTELPFLNGDLNQSKPMGTQ